MEPIERFYRYRLMVERLERMAEELLLVAGTLDEDTREGDKQSRAYIHLCHAIELLRMGEREARSSHELLNESPERMRRERQP